VRTVRNTQIHCGQSVPHRKHHVSATEPNRLMLCGETVAVCCENRMEHTHTLWAVRTSVETRHVPATEHTTCELGRNTTSCLLCRIHASRTTAARFQSGTTYLAVNAHGSVETFHPARVSGVLHNWTSTLRAKRPPPPPYLPEMQLGPSRPYTRHQCTADGIPDPESSF
jgi:hypothetical protein